MKNKWLLGLLASILLVSVFAAFCFMAPTPAGATPAEFYKGKTMKIIIPSAAGSSHDIYTRLIAPYWKKYTGATVIVVNIPAGGGAAGNNAVYTGKSNGLLLGTYQFLTTALNQIFEMPGVKYDIEKFTYVYGITSEQHAFCVTPDGPYQTIAALKAAKNLKFAGSSPRGNYALATMTVADILDLDCTVTTGIKTTEMALGIKRGEIDGACFTTNAARVFTRKGLAKALFILGTERHPAFPEVPTITEIAGSIPQAKLDAVKLWQDVLRGVRMTYLPPGAPVDRVKFLKETFAKIWSEPKFRKAAEDLAGYRPIRISTAEEVLGMAKSLRKRQKELKATFLDVIKKYSR